MQAIDAAESFLALMDAGSTDRTFDIGPAPVQPVVRLIWPNRNRTRRTTSTKPRRPPPPAMALLPLR
jgi:hypothetical protein